MTLPFDSGITKILLGEKICRGKGLLGGFAFAIDPAVPYIATAIHAGNRVRNELMPLMQLSPEERFLEEDPETDTMIQNAASAIWGLDSRSEYDLNRPRQDAIPLTPEKFWGMRVYRELLSDEMIRLSMKKYDQFYTLMESWARASLCRFGVCIVYDIHSYNVTRQIKRGFPTPPFFNVGTRLLDRRRWQTAIEDWIDRLGRISIAGVETTVAENCVFEGKGELCRKMTALDERILVLPTEVSKAYMDEKRGIIDKRKVKSLQEHFGSAMKGHSRRFLRHYG